MNIEYPITDFAFLICFLVTVLFSWNVKGFYKYILGRAKICLSMYEKPYFIYKSENQSFGNSYFNENMWKPTEKRLKNT